MREVWQIEQGCRASSSPECAVAPDLHSCRQICRRSESPLPRLFKGVSDVACSSRRNFDP
jgi:hypothetical protein